MQKIRLPDTCREGFPSAVYGRADISEVAHITVVLNKTDADVVHEVTAFALDHHLTVMPSPSPRLLNFSGQVGDLERAFNVDLHLTQDPITHHIARVRKGEVSVPEGLAEHIVAVMGLDNRRVGKPQIVLPRAASHATALDVPQIKAAMKWPADVDGTGRCIAIIELGGGFFIPDLKHHFDRLNLPMPKVVAVSVMGGLNRPGSTGADYEVMLDIEVAGSGAPGATIVVYFAPNTDAGFTNAVAAAAHDQIYKPDTISISWGAPENEWTVASMKAFNLVCEDAQNLGKAVFTASGDSGAKDGESDKRVDFPASSPNVTGCGGTHLLLADDTGKVASQVVWNDGQGGASGGGISRVFPLPDFQKDAKVYKAPNGFVGRGVPDIAANADPATGYKCYVNGQDVVIGGTSAVAPLYAALFACYAQKGKQLGFINRKLYTIDPKSFWDVRAGNNEGYSAQKHWDAATGLGSLIATEVEAHI
jgi:kumamolisin